MKKPLLYLLIETKARELEGKTLLGLEAASRGFRVVIGDKGQVYEGARKGVLPPGIFYEKSLTRGKEEKLKEIVDLGFEMVSQDEEGGLLDRSFDKFISFRSSPETVGLASSVFCWGEHDYSAWMRHYPDARHRIRVTGSPRVDFWRPDHTGYFSRDVAELRQRFGDFVMVSSNFTLANSYMSLEARVEQGKSNGNIRDETEEQAFRRRHRDTCAMFEQFAQMIEALSSSRPDLNIVVRPHPGERVAAWTDRLPDRDNIHVVFEGGVDKWVRACRAVIHNGCTTGMDAWVAGTPPIAYVPFSSPINKEIPNRLSIQCASAEEVIGLMPDVLKGQCRPDSDHDNEMMVRHRLANIQGATAVENIVAALEELPLDSRASIARGVRARLLELRVLVRRLRARFDATLSRKNRKFPGLKLREIEAIRDNLASVKPAYARCKVEHLIGDLFTIEN